MTKRFKLSLVLALVLTGFSLFVGVSKVAALSGSDFKANRIIDDGVFFNPNTMSQAQIQEFLNAKVPVCDTQGTQNYGGQTRAQYSASRGYYPPFTCLKDYRTDTVNKGVESGICNGHTAGNKSAAQIIYEVSQSCGINPKVLLVLLQKEQSLITDDWPWPTQYRSATGYGCPDTAPCDAEYYGYFNQVYMAARQFKRYAAFPNNYNYRANRNNFIQYNPNANCGGSNVFINNSATAGLYNYTPYQPNAAALNNLYGTGDGCSAYGNRNFWRMYNDWFGSTLVPDFAWSTLGYEMWNANKTSRVDPGFLEPGERYVAVIQALNVGSATWTSGGPNPVYLGSFNNSIFCNSTWLACNRPAQLVPSSVAPGQTATFEFSFNAPMTLGEYRESFQPVAEMLSWFPVHGNASFGVRVVSPGSFSWATGGYELWNANKTSRVDPGRLEPGTRYVAIVRALNTGSATWKANSATPMMLGSENNSVFCTSGWVACNRPARLTESTVAPGQTGTFEFPFVSPPTPGQYRQAFRPVAEFLSWTNRTNNDELGVWVVSPGTFIWEMGGFEIWNEAKTVRVDPGQVITNQRYTVVVTGRNNGTATWKRGGATPVVMAAPSGMSALCTNLWIACHRPVPLKEESVAPGQNGTFEFVIQAPATNTRFSYRQRFKPVAEMLSWFNDDPDDTLGIIVNP